ncbi:hypothetical protein CANCADRAFT_26191, partial [Tortispora caseinolytica NRRL Y-17796]
DHSLTSEKNIALHDKAGQASNRALARVCELIVPGAKIIDICRKGDEIIIEEATKEAGSDSKISKGVAFPTCVSPDVYVTHLSPVESEESAEWVIKSGSTVRVALGAQIGGFGTVVADTLVVDAAVVEGRAADVITAAWKASEAAIQTLVPGKKNWDVTSVVGKVAAAYECTPLEGMLSHNVEYGLLDGKNKIIVNPTESQRSNIESVTFKEGDVWVLDVLISTGTGKTISSGVRTTIFKKTDTTYQLRLKTSRMVYSEVKKNFGTFPFSARSLNDYKKCRVGLQECQQHNLLVPYEVYEEKSGETVAHYLSTIRITKDGPVKIAGPNAPDFSKIKSDKSVED